MHTPGRAAHDGVQEWKFGTGGSTSRQRDPNGECDIETVGVALLSTSQLHERALIQLATSYSCLFSPFYILVQ